MVVRQDLEYLKPIDFRDEPYEVGTAVVALGSRSFTLAVEIRDPASRRVFATARTVVVGVSPLTTISGWRCRSGPSEQALATKASVLASCLGVHRRCSPSSTRRAPCRSTTHAPVAL